MAHNTQNAVAESSYIVVLLLLAYFMSSAPKYLREFRSNHGKIKIETVSPIKQVLKMGKYYTIDPYMRVWNKLSTDPNTTPILVQNAASR